MFGIARRVPMVEIRNDTAPIVAGGDLSDAIIRAASARRWTASVTAPGVVRCKFDTRSWNIEVDVRYSGQTFSIDYVGSEGLFYRQEMRDIHPSYNKQVEALRQRIKQEAMRQPQLVVAGVVSGAAAVSQPQVAKPYTIELFTRESGEDVAYRFVLALADSGAADLALSRRIQADLRESVRADYASSAAVKDPGSLQIDFPQYVIRDGKVEGRAVVMTVELLEFVYDPATAHGRLAVKVNPRQYEVTRQWVRRNIATLARDKSANILSAFSGEQRFTIGREILRDDNVLEVEFKAGE